MEERFALDTLSKTLRQIEDLWERLIHVKWDREGFVTLAQAAQDAVQLVHNLTGRENLAELLIQLDQQLSDCLLSGQLPQEVERERLQLLVQMIHQTAAQEPTGDRKTSRAGQFPTGKEILLVADEHAQELISELESAGFRVRHLSNLADVRAMLAQTTPAVAIVDMDCHGGASLAGINMIAKENDRIDPKAPTFFISERGDLMARLEAASAGGTGYFTKPLDMLKLLDALNGCLRHEANQSRVLIVNDNVKELREIALILEARGLIVQTLDSPLEVIQVLYRFQPDLLLLDLDLREINGLELAKVVRQLPDFASLPLVVLATQSDLNRRLAALKAGADDLLAKPVAADTLFTTVSCHLQRARALHHQLASINQRDTISGLYNRRYFLVQLRRLLSAAEGPAAAVLLITLDNLRAVAAMDVAASDDMVEQAAGRLQAVLGPGQLAARFNDAIFAVLDRGGERESLLDSARTLRRVLETEPYRVSGEQMPLRTSIGISIASQGERDYMRLIQQADLACSSAWVGGGEHIQFYHPQEEAKVQASQQKSLLDDIRETVKQQRMHLVFQPIVSMQGDPAERYEVLLRMYKEGRELLPETVFNVTQGHRLGMVLDRWVIAQSIRVLKERQKRVQETTLFVNISPAILRDEEFVNWLKGGLEKTGVLSDRLVFEMAEATAEQHLQGLHEFLNKIKPLGCGFSLDQFSGTEGSLGLLKKLPVNYVKLKGHFASDLAEDKHKQQQLKNLAQQLSALQVTTVASNIEKLPTLFALWSCGVNYVQGFFLQRPHEEMTYDFTSGAF